jgi:hypothetical protein
MTEAERCKEKLAEARSHPGLGDAMRTPPPTWLGIALLVSVLMVGIWFLTFAIMPSGRDMDRLPGFFRAQMAISFIPTTVITIACAWLLIDAIGLALKPTRYLLAVAEQRVHAPAPYFIRLITEDGADREYRARRRAASLVKLGLVEPGQVGVAVMKGDICLQWVPLAPHPGRIYDRA